MTRLERWTAQGHRRLLTDGCKGTRTSGARNGWASRGTERGLGLQDRMLRFAQQDLMSPPPGTENRFDAQQGAQGTGLEARRTPNRITSRHRAGSYSRRKMW